MRLSNVCLALAVVSAVTVNTAQAQINGIKDNRRTFNDFSTTNLVVVNGNSVNQGAPSLVTIDESLWTDDGMGGNFANRHDFTLSSDNGASNHVFGIDDSFTVKALVTLAAGSNAPRKEAGLRINSPITDNALFLVNSDAGEIVAFGGGAPFKSFGNNGGGNGYTPGTTILMGFTIRGNGAAANTTEYFIDRTPGVAGGEENSGPLAWSNLEEGPITYNVALYSQASPNLSNTAEFVSTDFNDIMYSAIPEPASAALGLMGMLALAGLIRRR